jgi:CBS domain-containing protein
MSTDTMKSFVKTKMHMVEPQSSVIEIFNLMKSNKIHHVPVVENGEAVGIISDRDVQFVNHADNSFQMTAKDIMTANPYTVDAMTSVPHAVNTMTQKGINSILIHDDSKKIVGIFTSTDALNILSNHYKSNSEE